VQVKDADIERDGLAKCNPASGCLPVGGPAPPQSRDAASRADRPSDLSQGASGQWNELISKSVAELKVSGARGGDTNTNYGFQVETNFTSQATAAAATASSDDVSAAATAAADNGLLDNATSTSAGIDRQGWEQPTWGVNTEALSDAHSLPPPPQLPHDSDAGAAPSPLLSDPASWQGAAGVNKAHQLRLSLQSEQAMEDWWPLLFLTAAVVSAAAAVGRRAAVRARAAQRVQKRASSPVAAVTSCKLSSQVLCPTRAPR
jgi:hypothetical protein